MPHITHDLNFHGVPVRAYMGDHCRWITIEHDGWKMTAFLDQAQCLRLGHDLLAMARAGLDTDDEAGDE
jgi:hypothetical protein